MAFDDAQMGLEDVSEEYREFVEKFKRAKGTDDCYTPENVYEAVKAWACEEYGIDPETCVRPFWPDTDYRRFEYPEGCTVLDNPPFSIITKICRDYMAEGIRFFLFAPHLTNFNIGFGETGICHIITNYSITYHNGAIVNTGFVTNLDACFARTVHELREKIMEADMQDQKQKARKELPKYQYPANVATAAMLGDLARHGVDFRLRRESVRQIRRLETMRMAGKEIFGGGVLLSEKAAAEKAAAEKAAAEKAAAIVWELSEQEKEIIRTLE